MVNSRAKGGRYERQLVKEFVDMGWKDCVTSRSESKRMDDAGVDLCYTPPFNVQAKAWEKAPSYHDVLAKMPVKGTNVLFHKKNHKGEVVVMMKEAFYELVNMLIKHKVITI